MRVFRPLAKTAIRFTTLAFSLIVWPSSLALAGSDLHRVTEGLAVGEAVQYEGLTLYPVLATRELPSGDYISMQQALAQGSLTIHEKDGGNVPTLEVVNRGTTPVLLVVGDVVKGGRQDRVIAQDVIIKPSGVPQVVAVNCVEAGRWAHQGAGVGASFSYGGRGEAELKEVLQHEANQGATWATVAELNDDKRKKLIALSAMEDLTEDQAAKTVDEVLAASGYEESQPVTIDHDSPIQQRQAFRGGPFDSIQHNSETLAGTAYAELAPRSGTYMASIDSEAIRSRADTMVEALLPGLEAELQVVGLVAAVGSELITAELYGDAGLFDLSKASILRGLALDALSDEQLTHPAPPSAEQAAEFLSLALEGKVVEEEEVDGSTKLRRMTETSSSFEFEGDQGDFLHINVYAR